MPQYAPRSTVVISTAALQDPALGAGEGVPAPLHQRPRRKRTEPVLCCLTVHDLHLQPQIESLFAVGPWQKEQERKCYTSYCPSPSMQPTAECHSEYRDVRMSKSRLHNVTTQQVECLAPQSNSQEMAHLCRIATFCLTH